MTAHNEAVKGITAVVLLIWQIGKLWQLRERGDNTGEGPAHFGGGTIRILRPFGMEFRCRFLATPLVGLQMNRAGRANEEN